MNFISGLPKTRRGFDMIWVIIYRLTKIVWLLGVPTSIVPDRDARFTSHFWKSLRKALGTQLHFSTAFTPQIDR